MTTTRRHFRIATRGSLLARRQSEWVAARLVELGAQAGLFEVSTRGDVQQVGSVAGIGGIGVFTKEVQSAVLDGAADLAVHSLKDLPTAQTPGLSLAAVPAREIVDDALVSRANVTLADLKAGSVVGTGSLRRQAQLLHLRPDLQVRGIRGNVDTRLRKLDAGEFDAILLAAAGLLRLGLTDRITEYLSPPRMLPAPGQGALAIECRENDGELLELLGRLDDRSTRWTTMAERAVLAELHGGCSAPIGTWGRIEGGELVLDALVADVEGRQVLRQSARCDLSRPGSLTEAHLLATSCGRSAAMRLLDAGAAKLIESARLG